MGWLSWVIAPPGASLQKKSDLYNEQVKWASDQMGQNETFCL